jgi:hypothetical protein
VARGYPGEVLSSEMDFSGVPTLCNYGEGNTVRTATRGA